MLDSDAGQADNFDEMDATAARHLANVGTAERAHGDVNAYRASVDRLYRPTDDGAPNVAPAPDPFSGDQHAVRRGFNRKRGATVEVIPHRRGVASVVGAIDCQADGSTIGPVVTDDGRGISAMVVRETLRAALAGDAVTIDGESYRLRDRANGHNAIDLAALTTLLYGEHLDAPVGTDALSWQAVGAPDDPAQVAIHGRHRCDMVGGRTDVPLALDRAVYTAQTGNQYREHACGDVGTPRPTIPHPEPRCRLAPLGQLRGAERERAAAGQLPAPAEHPRRTVTVRGWFGVNREPMATRYTYDRGPQAFYGHGHPEPRPEPTRARGKRAARTIGTVTERNAPTTEQGWRTVVAALNRGDRVVIRAAFGAVRINRSAAKSGRYTVTVRADGVTIKVASGVRTPDAVARKLTAFD